MAAYCNGAMSYSNTDGCYGAGKHGHGHNGGRTMSYSTTTADMVKCHGAGEHYKRVEKQHGSRERVGEAGAFFGLCAGYEAKKKDPAHGRKHQSVAGVAGAAAPGAGDQQHRGQKQAGYGGGGAPKKIDE